MLTLTFKSAKDAEACVRRYKKFAKFKGGIKNWGENRPFPLIEVLEVCGLEDALWALRCCEPVADRDRIARLFACDCAERVLPIFEKEYPDDKRPRLAIEAARKFAIGQATQEELFAAWDAAWAARDAAWVAAWAARDAAGAAAWAARDAARDAAGAAEREWQKQRLAELLQQW